MTATFSEEEYYAGYKRVRNLFRRYDPIGLIELARDYLLGPGEKIERIQRHPWLILLLIKWVLIDDNFLHKGRPTPTREQAFEIFQAMHTLGDRARHPGHYENIVLWMRATAYQQFLYQSPFSTADYIRQFLIFGDLPSEHPLNQTFERLIGLSIYECLQFSIALLTRFADPANTFVDVSWFNALKIENVLPKAASFLSVISGTHLQLRARLKENDDGRRRASEHYEQTQLMLWPLIEHNGKYHIYHQNILFRGLEHFIHDKLRIPDAQGFMRYFGDLFESHVDATVKSSGLPFISEDNLLNMGKRDGNLIDFIIEDGDAHIFVDAKGVTTNHHIMVSPGGQLIRERTSHYALKAIRQALNVNAWLYLTAQLPVAWQPKKESFLIVVTYRDLFLGNGKTFRDAIGGEHVDELYTEHKHSDRLPLENIYFMHIDSFEVLCQAVSAKRIGIADALRHARLLDGDPKTKKFDFRLHCAALKLPRGGPEFMTKRYEQEFSKLEQILR